MSAVAGFLLLMTSSLVRDIYQRNWNPNISPRNVKWITYGTTAVVGTIVTLAALQPPTYLQHLIIFTTGGMACTYLAPTVLALYSRRATKAGALTAMISGFATVMSFYVLGWQGIGKGGLTGPASQSVTPVYLFGLDPLVYGMLVSFGLGFIVSRFTPLPPASHVDRYFLTQNT
jgi:SSS family solute:Na+ symporter/sodium/pantothenate symporter